MDDGTLVPRGREGAVLTDPAEIAERAVRLALEGVVTTVSGHDLAVDVDTILVHGDTPDAVATATAVRQALEDAGVRVAPVGSAA